MFAIKTPSGFLRSISDNGEIEETKSIHYAEWIKSHGMACATVRFIISSFPHHKRFSIYSFKIHPAVLPAPLRSRSATDIKHVYLKTRESSNTVL